MIVVLLVTQEMLVLGLDGSNMLLLTLITSILNNRVASSVHLLLFGAYPVLMFDS